MKLQRIAVRFPSDDVDAVDQLRARYADESRRRLSRASVVRVLLHLALRGADNRSATETLEGAHHALTLRSIPAASMPKSRPTEAALEGYWLAREAPESEDDAAPTEDLERWLDRVLTAKTLDEALDPPS